MAPPTRALAPSPVLCLTGSSLSAGSVSGGRVLLRPPLAALGSAARPAGPRLRLRAAAECLGWDSSSAVGCGRLVRLVGLFVGLAPRLLGLAAVLPAEPRPARSARARLRPYRRPLGPSPGGVSPPSCPVAPAPACCVRPPGLRRSGRPPLPAVAVAPFGLRPAAKRHGGYRVPPFAARPLPAPLRLLRPGRVLTARGSSPRGGPSVGGGKPPPNGRCAVPPLGLGW